MEQDNNQNEPSSFGQMIETMSSGNTAYTFDGGLVNQCRSALQELYSKESGSVSMETQQLDSQALSNWEALNSSDWHVKNTGKDLVMVYGKAATDVGVSDLMTISRISAQMTPRETAKSAVILEPSTGRESACCAVLEDYCKKKGIPVYRSLEAFKKARKL